MGKSLINQGIGLFNLFGNVEVKKQQINCVAITGLTHIFDTNLTKALREGCGEFFKFHDVSNREIILYL